MLLRKSAVINLWHTNQIWIAKAFWLDHHELSFIVPLTGHWHLLLIPCYICLTVLSVFSSYCCIN